MTLSYASWVAFIDRHRRGVLAASALISVLAALSLTRLRFDMDVLSMLPQGTAAFDDFKLYVAHFGELDELVILLHDAPPAELRHFADRFAAKLGALDTIAHVQARVDTEALIEGLLGRYLPNYLPDSAYDVLRTRLEPGGIERQIDANRAVLGAPFDLTGVRQVREDPLGLRRLALEGLRSSLGNAAAGQDGYLAAADGTAQLLLARPVGAAFDVPFAERLLREVRAAEAQVRQELGGPSIRVDYTGSYVYALEDAGTIRGDITRYTLLALAAVLLTFLAGYRNLRILPFVTYPLIVTTLIDFAASLLLFDQLNAASLSFAAILYGLTVDSAIHFYTRLLQERERHELRAAVTATLAGLGRANVIASATTAAAFAVIGLSCLAAVRQLGLMTALGMVINILTFFTLYPALALSTAGARSGLRSVATPNLARLARGVARHARAVTLVTAVLGAALLAVAARVRLDPALAHLRPQGSAAGRIEELIRVRFGQPDAGSAVVVRRPTLEAALIDAETIAGVLERHRAEGLIAGVQSVRMLLPSAAEQRRRLARYEALARAEAVAALRAALAHHGFNTEQFEPFFTRFLAPVEGVITLDDAALAPLRPLIYRYVRARSGEFMVASYIEPAAGRSLAEVAARLRQELPQLAPIVASRLLLEQELGRVLRREVVMFLALALLGNLALLRLAAPSFLLAFVLLAPALLGLLGVFALMVPWDVSLDPINIVVAPLILGIGVDDAVYLYAHARAGEAIDAAVLDGGRALVMTTTTTVVGFGCLALSRFTPLATMGVLAGTGLMLALLWTLVSLPAFLAELNRQEAKDAKAR